MRRCLLAIAATGLACSSHVPGPQEIWRLPIDLPEPSVTRHAEGRITGADKKPLAGALVSVIDPRSYRGVGFSVSDQDGRFSVGLPSTRVVVTATARGRVVGTLVPDASNRFSLTLATPSEGTQRFSGTVLDTKGQPLAQVRVRLMHWGWLESDTFYTISDRSGNFEFSVDAAGSYDLMVDDPRYISNFAPWPYGDRDATRLIAYDRDWIRARANYADEPALGNFCIPLTRDGIQRFADSLQASRVIGLGESTHGTREFTELRSRLIDALTQSGGMDA